MRDVPVTELYDAAVTVMMRLIFLFYAEENDLLPVAEPLYNERYAASTLRERLQAAADEHGEEVLETTHDGWPRLLATWRAVFGGVEHGDMVLAPYGGSLFDPDRYPFLEGRQPDTSWTSDVADPLPIDNRTVLHLLNALQTLDEGGQRRKLSFRALDVEQIGHVYEGMLDHTAARADGWVFGLSGTGGFDPEIELAHLESFDERALFDFLNEQTGRSLATLKKWVSDAEADKAVTKFGVTWAATLADADLKARARRFAKLIRPDSTGAPTIFQPGSVYVADSSHRGATGTQYTPRSLTEEIVKHTLDVLVYIGPADGAPEDQWKLRSPEEILALKICDPACGSGAFLVQACRYLADAVVEANRTHHRRSDPITEDEVIDARRQVAERSLHGVDINPMACEMAKLSLWLVTLAHDRPFTFLDHAIRNGDSLVGITSIEHLETLASRSRSRANEARLFVEGRLDPILAELRACQNVIQSQSNDIADINEKRFAFVRSQTLVQSLRNLANLLSVASFSSSSSPRLNELDIMAALDGDHPSGSFIESDASRLSVDESSSFVEWPLDFPGCFLESGGFDAIVGNPPFLGGKKISQTFGDDYRRAIIDNRSYDAVGNADYVAFFLLLCSRICRPGAVWGLVVNEAVLQGDTRRAGLGRLHSLGWDVVRSTSVAAWPGGGANVQVVRLWIRQQPIPGWSIAPDVLPAVSFGDGSQAALQDPKDLSVCRELRSYQGSVLVGDGFIITRDEAEALVAIDQRNSVVVKRLLNTSDLSENPQLEPARYVIDFHAMSVSVAAKYSVPFAIVRDRVKPERDKKKRKAHREKWWQYGDKRPELYRQCKDIEKVLVFPRTSKFVMPVLVSPAGVVFSDSLVVIPIADYWMYAALASSAHFHWAALTSNRRGTDRLNYVPTRSFDTFPFVEELNSPDIDDAGRELERTVRQLLEELECGMTDLYNLVNSETGGYAVEPLRRAHINVDKLVLGAFGVRLDHPHSVRETRLGPRFTTDGRDTETALAALASANDVFCG